MPTPFTFPWKGHTALEAWRRVCWWTPNWWRCLWIGSSLCDPRKLWHGHYKALTKGLDFLQMLAPVKSYPSRKSHQRIWRLSIGRPLSDSLLSTLLLIATLSPVAHSHHPNGCQGCCHVSCYDTAPWIHLVTFYWPNAAIRLSSPTEMLRPEPQGSLYNA